MSCFLFGYQPLRYDGFSYYNNFVMYLRKNQHMSAEDKLVLDYMAMLRTWPLGTKLKLLALLTESIASDYSATQEETDDSWKALYGAWKDMDEDLAEQIRSARLPGRNVPSFDE
jgi:hypothetical protein